MSNIYNQQLSQALTNVDNTLNQSELTEGNTMQSAKVALYYAHGLTVKNENQLEEHQQQSKVASEQSKVASIGVTATQNIVTASNAAVLDASNTTSSASATAASIQKAATALTNLSGNVATTMAVATSLDKGSKIQFLVDKANRATKEAARLAEEASLIALNLTIEASQSRAANVVAQAGTVKGNMVTLQKSLADTFAKLQDQVTENMTDVSTAISEESVEAGTYKTAQAEDTALRQSEAFINQYINHDLAITIPGLEDGQPVDVGPEGDQFTLSFSAFQEKENDKWIISEYRLILVKEDDAAGFNTEMAKATPLDNCVSITPSGLASYKQPYVTSDFVIVNSAKMVKLGVRMARDYNGAPVTRGTPYTFFVYVVYTQDYQSDYNNTNGLLSQAAPVFTLETSLPVVDARQTSMIFFKENELDAVQIAFKMTDESMMIGSDIDLDELMEFRAFIFSSKDNEALALNLQIDKATSMLFKLERSYRLSEQKYQDAEQAYNTAIAQGAAPAVIDDLKQRLNMAKAQNQEAKKQYTAQVTEVEQLNQAKISDFMVDESILESVPVANGLLAKRNDSVIEELTNEISKLNKELDQFNAEFVANDSKLQALNKEMTDLNNALQEKLKVEDTDHSAEDALKKELAEKIAQFEKMHNTPVSIKTEQDAKDIQSKLNDEQKDEDLLLVAILDLFRRIDVIEVQLPPLTNEIIGLRAKLKNASTEVILLDAKQRILQDQRDQLPVLLGKLSTQLQALGTYDKTYRYYVASDTAGAFTDNYGEQLMPGKSYCAVLLSIIKDSEPDAAGLYMNRMSRFSADVVFN
ncbi:MAG: hypothetical protein ACOYXT_15340 [Bacteroidota bacterium]